MSEAFFDLLMVTLVAGAAGGAGWFASFRNLIKARTIEDTPTSKIRSAHQGYVELTGSAGEGDDGPVLGKLTGNTCLWYSYRIEKYESSGKSSHWRTIEKGASSRPFQLDDGSGRCYIHPDRAEVTTHRRQVWYGGSRLPTSTVDGGLFNRRYRYTEERLHDGDLLYCIGQFQSLHPPSVKEQTRKRAGELLNQWKQDYDALVTRFDRNGDGEVDLKEWQHVRNQAELTAYREVRENYDHSPVHVLSYSPSRRQPFLIATSDPKRLAKGYRWRFMGYGALAIGCTVGFFVLLPTLFQAW